MSKLFSNVTNIWKIINTRDCHTPVDASRRSLLSKGLLDCHCSSGATLRIWSPRSTLHIAAYTARVTPWELGLWKTFWTQCLPPETHLGTLPTWAHLQSPSATLGLLLFGIFQRKSDSKSQPSPGWGQLRGQNELFKITNYSLTAF